MSSKNIKLLSHQLANIEKDIFELNAIQQGFVSAGKFGSEKFDKLVDKVLNKINNLQKKWKESPCYIEGFSITLGVPSSFSINFKLRED